MELIEALQYEWAVRALLASAMVGIMCGVLGCFIVLRNMSLIGDALSHAILPGVAFGFMIAGYNVLGFFLGSVAAGLFAAVAMTWIQRNVKTKNDAAIGIVFTAMFSIGVMVISWLSRHEKVHLDLHDFLFGNLLGVSNSDLYLTGAIGIYVLVNIVLFYRYLFATTFQPVIAETMGISVSTVHYFLMLLLSFAVVASLKSVGVILVVAMLITPAATALLLTNRLQWVLVIAGIFGLLSAVLGLYVAIVFETTPGPAMTVVATCFYLLAVFFAPEKGLIFKYFHQIKLKEKILLEDILKQTLKLEEKDFATADKLVHQLGFNAKTIRRKLKEMSMKGLLSVEQTKIKLTETGRQQATRLIRAHRLWETYLVQQVGLSAGQIHEDAEKYEHILTDELLDEMDVQLGYPQLDPHGSPIPKKTNLPEMVLSQVAVLEQAVIASAQMTDYITASLWKLGLLPQTKIIVKHVGQQNMELEQNGKIIEVPMALARKIAVTR